MGFMDKIKGVVAKNTDKVDGALAKAGDLADDRTKGQHTSQIDSAEKQAKKMVDGLDDKR